MLLGRDVGFNRARVGMGTRRVGVVVVIVVRAVIGWLLLLMSISCAVSIGVVLLGVRARSAVVMNTMWMRAIVSSG